MTHAGPHAWEPDEAPTYRCCLEDRHGDPCPAIDYRRLRSIRDAAIIEADPEDVASWEAHRERYAEDALARSEGRTWAGREPDRTPAVDEYLAGAREERPEMPTLDLFAQAAAPEPRPHPAAWSLPLIDALRGIVPPGLVVDPFGGTGKLALLGQRWRVLCGDLEPEWVGQAWRYGAKGLRWDATALPLAAPCIREERDPIMSESSIRERCLERFSEYHNKCGRKISFHLLFLFDIKCNGDARFAFD